MAKLIHCSSTNFQFSFWSLNS